MRFRTQIQTGVHKNLELTSTVGNTVISHVQESAADIKGELNLKVMTECSNSTRLGDRGCHSHQIGQG